MNTPSGEQASSIPNSIRINMPGKILLIYNKKYFCSLKNRRFLFITGLLLVFFSSLFLYSRGVNWALSHPDERRIAEWIRETDNSSGCPYIKSRVYPEGFFVLGRVFNYIDKETKRLAGHTEDWSWQSELEYGFNSEKEPHRKQTLIHKIRHWNAMLMSLSAVFVFITAYIILNNALVAVPGALLYALHPFIVEHAHYAETDSIMLFSVTLALALLTLSLKKLNPPLLLISSFIAGFAVASKYSLTAITFIVPVCAVALGLGKNWGKWQISLIAVGSLVVLAAGFLAGTPKLCLAPGLFFHQARTATSLTYGEIEGLLGESAGRPFAPLIFKLRSIFDEACKCGWLWWLLCIGSIPLWFKREIRQSFASFPLFGLSYPILAAFFFPWFRTQEFLPLLPFSSISAILPFYFSLKMKRSRCKIAAVILSLAALSAVMLSTLSRGMRMASAFSAIETRSAASDWTAECAPYGAKYIFEIYSCSSFPFPIARNGLSEIETVSKIETYEIDSGQPFCCDYFLRTVDMKGRGNIDPVSGKLYPSRQKKFDNIITNSALLATWKIIPGQRPVFGQPAVELYSFNTPCTNVIDIPIPQSSPIVIKSKHYGYTGFRASINNGLLGPTEALGIVCKRKKVEFDPLPPGGKYYAVAVNLTGGEDIEVEWSNGFSPTRQKIASGRAVLFTSNGSLSSLFDAVPSSKVRMHGNDQKSMCIAVITSNRDVAARTLKKFGNESAALTLESKDGISQEAMGKIISGLPPSRISFCGIPGKAISDFSRFRSGQKKFASDLETFDPRQKPRPDFHYVELPYVLEEKRYRLQMSFKPNKSLANTITQFENGITNPDFPECDLNGATLISTKVIGLNKDTGLNVEFVIDGHRRFEPFYFGIKSKYGINDEFAINNSELIWDFSPID